MFVRAVPGVLFITTLITAYKRPSFFYVPQHPGRHMNVLQDLVYYMEREIRRWQVVFGVLFLGKLCCNLPTVQVCHEVEGGGTGSMPGTHLAPAMAGTLRASRV